MVIPVRRRFHLRRILCEYRLYLQKRFAANTNIAVLCTLFRVNMNLQLQIYRYSVPHFYPFGERFHLRRIYEYRLCLQKGFAVKNIAVLCTLFRVNMNLQLQICRYSVPHFYSIIILLVYNRGSAPLYL